MHRAAGTALQSGSLLARGCEATAMLAGHSADIQKIAWTFGHHLGVAHAVSASARLSPNTLSSGLNFFVLRSFFALFSYSAVVTVLLCVMYDLLTFSDHVFTQNIQIEHTTWFVLLALQVVTFFFLVDCCRSVASHQSCTDSLCCVRTVHI